jgi:plasmid maintenance system antidote protein VapI
MCCNPIVNDSIITKDMALRVRLKGVTGKSRQGWRFMDKNNYYVVRANTLEDNVVCTK